MHPLARLALQYLAGMVATVVFLSLSGCMDGMGRGGMPMMGAADVVDRPPFTGPWGLVPLADLNASPSVVEFALEARLAEVALLDGKPASMWTYNGLVPGPLLEANVGDTVIVHFTNNLPEETTIHWHGLRIPAEMDGVAVRVPAGGTFEYRFTARDQGAFWYHPHVRSDVQVRQGLYGALVVHGPVEAALPSAMPVVLSDVLLDGNGAFQEASSDMVTQMDGPEGNVLLANGKVRPTLVLRPGERVRLQFINAAASRFFRLALPGHTFWLVGEDGGLLEHPVQLQEMLLVPGQRADVLVDAVGEPGAELDLQTLPYQRGHSNAASTPFNVLHVRYTQDTRVTAPAIPENLATIRVVVAGGVTRTLRLNEGMGASQHGMVFTINGQAYPNVPVITGRLASRETWEIVNEAPMDHPFHLHGFFFQVVDAAGNPVGHLAQRDTVNVPANTTVRLRVDVDGFPGRWMYHCHILSHAEHGMMGEFQVDP